LSASRVRELDLKDPELHRLIPANATSVKILRRPGDSFCVYNIPGSGFYTVSFRTGQVTKVPASSKVTVLNESGSYVTARIDTGLATYLFSDDRLDLSIQQFRDITTCCAVSDQFQTVVLGSRDGALSLHNLPSGVHSSVIELNGAVPHEVLVTDSFGFIVTAVTETVENESKHFLLVYTINGIFVRKMEIEGAVVQWTKWTSLKGFDYIAFKTSRDDGENLKLYICEVFYLKFSVVRCRTRAPIVAMRYLTDFDLLLVAHKDGKVTFYYQPSGDP
jgi:hypothetical protein